VRNNGEGATAGDFLAAVHGVMIRKRKNTLLFLFPEDSHSGNLIENIGSSQFNLYLCSP